MTTPATSFPGHALEDVDYDADYLWTCECGYMGEDLHERDKHLADVASGTVLRVAQTSGEALATVAASFTCDEAEAIEALLFAAGSPFWDDFRRIHAEGDGEPTDRHHNGWEER